MISLKIKLKHFGIPASKLNGANQEIQLPSDATIQQLIDVISNKAGYSESDMLKYATFLVNKSYAKNDTVLNDGDEVLILYTIGGG